jgi:5-hydroxyisourate hydrolase-like protein (transthyretin family)
VWHKSNCSGILPAVKLAATLAFLLLVPQQPAPPATGRIEGTVLRSETMEPVSGAKITVIRVNAVTGAALPVLGTSGGGGLGGPSAPLPPLPGAPGPNGQPGPVPSGPPPPSAIPPVTTDRDGKFVVTKLEEGSYRVAVAIDGYVRQEYGQRIFPGQGTPLKLAAGEVLKDLAIRLTPTAAINGRIADKDGKPAAGVLVQLVRVTYNATGQKVMQLPTRATTNDRGEYRLFFIAPGRYYLAAGTPPGNTSPIQPDWFPFIFYPNTMDPNRALIIDVKAGSEMAFDMVIPRQQPYSIRGRIVDAASAKPGAVGLSLAYSGMGGGVAYQHYGQSYNPTTGLFEIPDLPPGTYIVQANTGNASAQVLVEITDADVEGVNIIVSKGSSITGQVRMDGGGALPGAPTRIQLRRVVAGIANYVGFAPNGQAGADGTFKFEGVLDGQYRASITAPADHYVKEARFEGRDALNSPVEVAESRGASSALEIVLSPNVAQIDGVARNDRGQPVSGARIVLVPERNRERGELFTAATSDQSGRFNMRRIVPGDYRLFAWEAIENNAYFDPEVLKRDESRGILMRIDESARLNLEAKTIPADTK